MNNPLKSILWWLGWIAILTGGAWLRFQDLGIRPFHADEAVNGLKLAELRESGVARYDPLHYHGNTLWLLSNGYLRLHPHADHTNPSESDLRSFSAIAGWMLLLIPLVGWKTFGRTSSLACGLILAGSPALLAINRTYIHESLFILCCICGIAFMEKAPRSKHPLHWAIAGGVFWGLMASTKESWPLVLLCLGIGHGISRLFLGRNKADSGLKLRTTIRTWTWAISAALLTAIAMYSSWGRHPLGIRDALQTFFIYQNDPGHSKPWYYFLNLLFCSNRLGRWPTAEFLLIPFMIAGCHAMIRNVKREPAHLSWAITSLTLIGIHSMIPYKTPWLVTLPFVGIAFICSTGVKVILASKGFRIPSIVLLIVGSLIWGWAGYRSALLLPDHHSNRHAYSPTSPDVIRLTERIESIAFLHPDGRNLPIDVIFPQDSNYWPLPWYLRDYKRAAWRNEIPESHSASIIIAPHDMHLSPKQWPTTDYITEMRGLRPGLILRVMIRRDLWIALMESKELGTDSQDANSEPKQTIRDS